MGYSKRHSVLKTVWRFLTKLPIILRSWLGSNTQACYECYFKLKTVNSTADQSGFWGFSLSKRGEL